MRSILEGSMRLAPTLPSSVNPRLAALLCGALLVACSSDDALPTSASPAPLDARPAAAITIGPATPLPIPADCPSAFPVDINERGVIVGWADAPCFGANNSQAFRLYPDGTWDSLPEPYGQRVSPLSIGPRGEVYALVQNPEPHAYWLVAMIDPANDVTWLPLPTDGRDYGVLGRPNDRGTFVLSGSVPYGVPEYFLWNGRGEFEPLPMPPAGQRFQAAGLNDHDVVVGTIYEDTLAYAATWSRRQGYTVLPLPTAPVRVYGSMGDLIDARGRVYGQTILAQTDTTCPYWRDGSQALRPTTWDNRDVSRVLAGDQLRCRTNVLWREAPDGRFAVGILVGDAPDASLTPMFAFVASAEGRLALAPCPEGWSCMAAGIDRAGVLVGHMIAPDRSAYRAVSWTVSTKR
jgi:hypothetical protein